MAVAVKNGKPDGIGDPTNDAEDTLALDQPYTVRVVIEGASAILWHRWSVDSVEAKAGAAKGSKAKKTDDVESYIYRNDEGLVCLPGEYLRQSLIEASRYKQDPRSPRKSARDLFKAGVVAITELAPITGDDFPEGTKEWQYMDRRRVQVQRQGITRSRPGFHQGWRAEIHLLVLIPNYIPQGLLHDVLVDAGRLVGVADYRPTFGRFRVIEFAIERDAA